MLYLPKDKELLSAPVKMSSLLHEETCNVSNPSWVSKAQISQTDSSEVNKEIVKVPSLGWLWFSR